MSGRTPIPLPKLSEAFQTEVAKLKSLLEEKEPMHTELDRKVEHMEKILSSEEFICLDTGASLLQMAEQLDRIISQHGFSSKDYRNLASKFIKKVFASDQLLEHYKKVGKLALSLKDPSNKSSLDKLKDILGNICNLLVQFEWHCRLDQITELAEFDAIRKEVEKTQEYLLEEANMSMKKRAQSSRKKPNKRRKAKRKMQRSASAGDLPTKNPEMKECGALFYHTDCESGYESDSEAEVSQVWLSREVGKKTSEQEHQGTHLQKENRGNSRNDVLGTSREHDVPQLSSRLNSLQNIISCHLFPENQYLLKPENKSTESDQSQEIFQNPGSLDRSKTEHAMAYDSGGEVDDVTSDERKETSSAHSERELKGNDQLQKPTDEGKPPSCSKSFSPSSSSLISSPETETSERKYETLKALNDGTNMIINAVIDEYGNEEITGQLQSLITMIKKELHCIIDLQISDPAFGKEHLSNLLQETQNIRFQVRSLSIENNSNRIADLIPSCCEVITRCNTENLRLEFNDLKDKEINLLQKHLVEGNELDEINISYNEGISSKGFYQLGKLVIKHDVKKFYAADCDLSDDQLEQFINGMKKAKVERTGADKIFSSVRLTTTKQKRRDESESKKIYTETASKPKDTKQTVEQTVRMSRRENRGLSDEDIRNLQSESGQYAMLEELDISYSKNLTAKGFGHLAELVRNKALRKLKLSGFQLTTEKLNEFYKTLNLGYAVESSEPREMLLEELEVSYNDTMEPDAYKILGLMVKFCGTKRLSLAGCGLNEEHLRNLREQTKKYKMRGLNAADNRSIGKGIIEIAKIVEESNLDELDISQCMLTADDIQRFRKALGTSKLQYLNLSDDGRVPSAAYIEEICQLLPSVTKRGDLPSGTKLVLEWQSLFSRFRDDLQKAVDCTESELEVILNEKRGDVLFCNKERKLKDSASKTFDIQSTGSSK